MIGVATNFVSAIPGITDASDPLAVNPLSDEIYAAIRVAMFAVTLPVEAFSVDTNNCGGHVGQAVRLA